MVKLLYRLIIIFPLAILGTGMAVDLIYGEPLTAGELFLAVLFAAFLPIISRVGSQFRVIAIGGVLIVSAAVLFVTMRFGSADSKEAIIRAFIIIGISIGMSAVGFIVVKSRGVKITVALALLVFLIVTTFLGYLTTKIEMALCVVYIITVAFEESQRHFRRGETFDREKFVVFTWPFALAFFLIILLFKAPTKPYDWAIFVKMYERTKAITIEIKEKLFSRHSEDYDSAMLGFSGDGRIAGEVGGKGEEILKIVTSKRKNETIYLTGKIFANFDGHEWTSIPAYVEGERVIDSMMALSAALMYGEKSSNDYIRPENIDITFLPFSSKYMFAPSKYISLSDGFHAIEHTEQDGAIFFDKTQIINAQYKIVGLSVNYNPTAMNMITSGTYKVDEEAWDRMISAYRLYDFSDISFETAEGYADYVKAHYLSPVNVSGEVAETLKAIEEAGNTDYERLKLLESAFKSMTYTNTPGKLPGKVTDAESFLDYFLTESQKGYCVHYATAFCLMARAMGYPSRYVQGYQVPVTDSSDTRVDTSMAHAWPEVWLDGVGWVIFEPTPGRYTAGSGWATKAELAADAEGRSNSPQQDEYSYDNSETVIEFDKENVVEEEEKTPINWYIFAIPVAAFLLFAILFILIEVLISRHRFKKASADEKADILCVRIMNMLLFCGKKPMPGETLSEFGERLKSEGVEYGLGFIPCYERLLYSDRGVDADSLAEIVKSEESVARLLKETRKWLYLFYRLRSLYKK